MLPVTSYLASCVSKKHNTEHIWEVDLERFTHIAPVNSWNNEIPNRTWRCDCILVPDWNVLAHLFYLFAYLNAQRLVSSYDFIACIPVMYFLSELTYCSIFFKIKVWLNKWAWLFPQNREQGWDVLLWVSKGDLSHHKRVLDQCVGTQDELIMLCIAFASECVWSKKFLS